MRSRLSVISDSTLWRARKSKSCCALAPASCGTNASNSEWYTMLGLICASMALPPSAYEMYWRPEKSEPDRYQLGCARSTSEPSVVLFKPATIWSLEMLAALNDELGERVPHKSGPEPPP